MTTERDSRPNGPHPMILIPIRGDALLPGQTLTLRGLDALPAAMRTQMTQGGIGLAVVPSLASDVDDPRTGMLDFGTEAETVEKIRMPDGGDGLVVRGLRRVKILSRKHHKGRHVSGLVVAIEDAGIPPAKQRMVTALARSVQDAAIAVARLSPNVSTDLTNRLAALRDPAKLADLVAAAAGLKFEEKLEILEKDDLAARLKLLLKCALREQQVLRLAEDVKARAMRQLQDADRRTLMQEQMRILKRELGDNAEERDEIDRLYEEIDRLELPASVREAVERELDRMELMPAGSSEYMVSYTYVSWIRDLPWGPVSLPPPPPLKAARRLLDKEHYGLHDVKERILEYLAVMRHGGRTGGEILLFAGPPGVGKTSLARSIAKTLGRPFVQVSLGGVKDEAEIRGHRRTYIGSMPGKLIQAIKDARTRAPVILLDEIDKVGLDQGRSVMASALLEVLDFEQNKNFTDHYLGVPYDLSDVIFICTANTTAELPKPLLDRLEVIELSSYTEAEKLMVASRHLVPAIRKELKLKAGQFTVGHKALAALIRNYTREAGVRQLKRDLKTIARKVIKARVEGRRPGQETKILPETMTKFLGPPRFQDEPNDAQLMPGVSIGLAYTAVGGDILYIETMLTAGDGKHRLSLTGSLGKVMRESVQAALSWLTSMAETRPGYIGFDPARITASHIHVHFPDGATPKDGPSAGLAIMCAVAGLLANKPLSAKLAMTGEITLRGQVLGIGGLKEKLLAAHRYGKTKVIIPAANHADLATVPKEILRDLEVIEVRTMEEALSHAGLVLPSVHPRRLRAVEKTSPLPRIAKGSGRRHALR